MDPTRLAAIAPDTAKARAYLNRQQIAALEAIHAAVRDDDFVIFVVGGARARPRDVLAAYVAEARASASAIIVEQFHPDPLEQVGVPANIKHRSGAWSSLGWFGDPISPDATVIALYGRPGPMLLEAASQIASNASRCVVLVAWTPRHRPPALPPGFAAHVVVVEPPARAEDEGEFEHIRTLVTPEAS